MFHNAYVRGTRGGEVADAEVNALADVLASRPTEIGLTGRGAFLPPEQPGGAHTRLTPSRAVSTALARRNIRSLLAHSSTADQISRALKLALVAPPQEAQDALEDAQIEFNLRYSLFACSDATLTIANRILLIADGHDSPVQIPRSGLRTIGGAFFSGPALDRLMGLDVAEVHLSPSAVTPIWMQLEPGAVMEPDTAHLQRHKGKRPSVRKADFVKDYCVACGRCFLHCPDNAIIHARFDPDSQDTTGILGIDTDRCTACGLCSAVCPTNGHGYKAIVMIEADAEGTPESHCVG